MTVTARRFASATLSGVAATYYTVPALTKGVVKNVNVCNSTGGAVNLTLYLVPSGGSPDATNILISARSVAAGGVDRCPEVVNQVLEAGATLQALGNGMTIVASGVEIT